MSYSVHQLKANVYHIADPIDVFMTLILGEEKALLLDTGHGLGSLDEIITQITNLPLIVVNSHGHLDHVLGNRFFDEAYLHPADFQLYQQHTTVDRKLSIASMRSTRPELFPSDFSPDTYLLDHKTRILPVDEGDVFDLGGVKLTVIHVPGHTPGGIALLDDRDRLLLAGDAASPHVWMFLPESTSISTYLKSLRKLRNLSDRYDGIVASHVPLVLPNDLIDRLIHCAEHIDPEKSVPYDPPFDDLEKGIMYFEGLDSLKDSLGMETLDLTEQAFYTLNLDLVDFSVTDFVSIVYDDAKL
ncbi:MAG: MBL fold metallo-hydrolase [Anaerolineae bacterium]|nr:MBL fold metallo-hydrolase [Anaerolineae bacterium]MCO5206841.1 MBL fold metallo-hydrolase [Anaerolineae bacterium]